MEKEIITMEKLMERCDELGTVLKYGNRVFTTWLDHASFNAEIYEFTETEEERLLQQLLLLQRLLSILIQQADTMACPQDNMHS